MHDVDRVKYNYLLDKNSWLHNRDYNKKEFINRIVVACQPLEYILDWYFTSDKETPFDLNEYAKQYDILKTEAEKVFKKSCWAN
jgi:adenine-specific DNA methylase